ncbi:MAG TPA: Dam family site-specific DNA-(adenine-N6)-methyltransferase [Methylobacter sp.]|jgi:DNA adenine methylase
MAKAPPYPFVKWAGGKSRVAQYVLRRLPDSIGTYYEPMVGGGAIFFELAKAKRFKNAVLADKNPDLINTWNVIQNNVEELIKELSNKKKYRYEKQTYMKIRSSTKDMTKVELAARFIFLNKTCFNGLYRLNSKGGFNVPFGKYEDPLICDEKNLRTVSHLLEDVDIILQDFGRATLDAADGDAIYFDPPYIPLSNTSKFTSYTSDGFTIDDHMRLAKTFKLLGDGGTRVVLSNSSAKAAIELYGGFDIDWIIGTRSVGGPADYRKSVKEMVVFHGPRGK